ncbi:tetratricopeptide repeat protein [Polynucleobacter paneuropaeus]|jgi:predicted O-linked N-acetylglucosamine transferase (SPINDLY family)|nr:tetratricopeptide repeat protein [Polynucleobacter paneuropaeus]MBT8615307.1 tetratricopeptide repeat protein [Polynucleobacter paneuropaeus]MBT8616788.1 tetratricopeptide repeat protein [Polynucleobacter paneuropaeus]MBT8618668.1 tetratricopeptide repeat protein [Polynucleobacter paneuropaeus]MBT8620951.1 tetratricopeptide repeat protein [Polynucleobacter paneuropaeus]
MLQKVFQALQENNFSDSEELLSKILEAEPKNPIALELMGVVCGLQKRPQQALFFFKKCLTVSPENSSLYFNIAKALTDLKKDKEAIKYHIKAAECDPGNYECWLNYGLSLANLGDHQEAIACYEHALLLKSDFMPAWFNKGLSLNQLGRYREALEAYEQTFKLAPHKNYLYGLIWKLRQNICQWEGQSTSANKILAALAANEKAIDPFSAMLLVDHGSVAFSAARIYADDLFPAKDKNFLIKYPLHKKIRIGYFSADFREHPVAQLTTELFELHDRDYYEILAFSLRGESKDSVMRSRIKNTVDHFLEVHNKSDEEIAQLAREYELDIAVDLGGYTDHARTGIFANRAAPIQVNYLGYPGTIGASYMDYIVADPVLIPEQSQKFFTEKVAYLPDTYLPNDRQRQIASKQFARSELGLPEQGFIFCCFNNNFKINPNVFDSWTRILAQVPRSVLWLRGGNQAAQENLIKEASKRGITADHLIFAARIDDHSEYLASYTLADMFLDTYPYNAHTTASDALWAGLPVLTLMGESFAARVAASLLNAIDLPELITHSQAEYESLAVELATHPEKLLQIKRKLQDNRLTKPLFDTPRYTKNIEAAYTQMYGRYQAGLPPDHLYI